MSAADGIGGFKPRPESIPITGSFPVAPGTAHHSFHPNNPYLQASPSQAFTTGPPQSGPSVGYPSYDPPPYELVPASGPATTNSMYDQGNERRGDEAYSSYKSPNYSQVSRGDQPVAPQPPSNFIDQAKARLNPRDPWNPPPTCFNRVVPPVSVATTYESLLHPFVIHAKPGKRFLDDAFVTTGTPSLYKHDVLVEDWVRLFEDIQITARLTGGQRVMAGVLPMTMNLGLGGLLVSRAIGKSMKRKNSASVIELLDIWNERFFKPRCLEVILCRGDWRLSRDNDKIKLPAPDRPHFHSRQRRDSSSSFSSSSSSSSSSSGSGDDRKGKGVSRGGRREMRRALKAERREQRCARRASREARRAERRGRKAMRRETRGSEKSGNYRLVVVSFAGPSQLGFA